MKKVIFNFLTFSILLTGSLGSASETYSLKKTSFFRKSCMRVIPDQEDVKVHKDFCKLAKLSPLGYEWDHKDRCWALTQQETYVRLNKAVCLYKKANRPVIFYSYNRLENFDVNSPQGHKNRRCYKFTNQGTFLGEVKDRSLCEQ